MTSTRAHNAAALALGSAKIATFRPASGAPESAAHIPAMTQGPPGRIATPAART